MTKSIQMSKRLSACPDQWKRYIQYLSDLDIDTDFEAQLDQHLAERYHATVDHNGLLIFNNESDYVLFMLEWS